MARQDSFRYFSHYGDTRNDLRIKGVRRQFGLEGYAMYFMLLEILTGEENQCIDLDEMGELLALDFDVDMEHFTAFIDYCVKVRLFSLDGTILYSESLRERFAEMSDKADAISDSRADAGKRGAAKRWSKKARTTEPEAPTAAPADSADMANDGKAMANYSKAMANDGKPEFCHDGKMANDGKANFCHDGKMANDSSAIICHNGKMANDGYTKQKEKKLNYKGDDDARTRTAHASTSTSPSPSEPEGPAQGKAAEAAQGTGQTFGSPQSPPHPSADTEEQWHDSLATNRTFREQVALAVGLRPAEVIDWLKTFRAECTAKGTRHESEGDLRRHAFDWLRCHKAYNNKPDKPNGTANPQSQSRHRIVERMASCDADYRVTAL